MESLRTNYVKQLSEPLAAKKEELVKQAIVYALGEDWTEDEAKRRFSWCNGSLEGDCLVFDETILLAFMPLEVKEEGYKITAGYRYKKFF